MTPGYADGMIVDISTDPAITGELSEEQRSAAQ
jgi:hypothetical protein